LEPLNEYAHVQSMSRDLVLWTGVLGGPFIWLASFETLFALNPWACTFQTKLALYIVSVVAFLLSLGACLIALREWNALGREADPRGGDKLSRSRMMALGGVLLSGFACVIIVAQAIPELVLGACQ
jgi:hypothetical protein